jgi:hypothetical protein
LCNLSVREPVARKVGDATLARSERIGPAERSTTRLGTARTQLGLCRIAHRNGTETVRRVERLAQVRPRFNAVVPAAKHRAEIHERTRPRDAGTGLLERRHGFSQQRTSPLASMRETGGAERNAEGTRRSEAPCERELFLRKLLRDCSIAERELRERGL